LVVGVGFVSLFCMNGMSGFLVVEFSYNSCLVYFRRPSPSVIIVFIIKNSW
jgi:hypothetical protein